METEPKINNFGSTTLERGGGKFPYELTTSMITFLICQEFQGNPHFYPFIGKFSRLPQILAANKEELGEVFCLLTTNTVSTVLHKNETVRSNNSNISSLIKCR